MTELDKAIEDLKKEYERIKDVSYIKYKIPYALYSVWRKYDKKARGDRR